MAHTATAAASATATISFLDKKRSSAVTADEIKIPDLSRLPRNVMGKSFSKPKVETPASADSEQVREVLISDYVPAAKSLAESFVEDHVERYLIDTPETESWTEAQKWDLHQFIMDCTVYAHCLKGLVTTVGENYGAVALWMPPGKNMDDLLTIFRSGLWRLYFKLPRENRARFFNEFLPTLHDSKASVLGSRDNEAWYLVYIGTRPEARGKGYARKLIEHVTKTADEEGRACYLESSNEINPRIYGKMGFRIHKRVCLERGKDPIPLDLMVREPGAAPCDGQMLK